MMYAYKWGHDGTVQERKAHCSIVGDLMHPGVQNKPEQVKCATAEKSSERLLFEIAAAHAGPLENLDIVNTYEQ